MAYKGIYILVTKDEYRIFAGDIDRKSTRLNSSHT